MADLVTDLEKLRAVSREGAGNEAAANAWKAVAQSKAEDLPVLLAAMDGANPLAENWLRAAISVVEDRDAKSLPLPALKKFVLSTKHSAGARALAFDILIRHAKDEAEAITPMLIEDPGAELRRHPVARLIEAGDAALAKNITAFTAAGVEAGYPKAGDPTIVKTTSVIPQGAQAWTIIGILTILVLYVTMVYGPIAAMLVEMFPTKIRYTSMSLPYHIGNGWFGGFLPTTAFAMVAGRNRGLFVAAVACGIDDAQGGGDPRDIVHISGEGPTQEGKSRPLRHPRLGDQCLERRDLPLEHGRIAARVAGHQDGRGVVGGFGADVDGHVPSVERRDLRPCRSFFAS
jgi:hypothetical protein